MSYDEADAIMDKYEKFQPKSLEDVKKLINFYYNSELRDERLNEEEPSKVLGHNVEYLKGVQDGLAMAASIPDYVVDAFTEANKLRWDENFIRKFGEAEFIRNFGKERLERHKRLTEAKKPKTEKKEKIKV
jgi:hypothetical protein